MLERLRVLDLTAKNIWKERGLKKELCNAIKKNEFTIYLQPKYHLKEQCYCGAESLVRWKKQDGNIISPGCFIPFMERKGIVSVLDFIVLDRVCRIQKKWMDEGKRLYPISINMSRVHFLDTSFPEKLISVVDAYGVPRSCVEIEVTESSVGKQEIEFTELITRLREDGILISIDDFGSGYSSFGMLKDVDVDVVKLDKSLFDCDMRKKKNYRVINDLIALCHALGQQVVAEGIEHESQADILKEMNCDVIQGYFFGKPMELVGYEELLYA